MVQNYKEFEMLETGGHSKKVENKHLQDNLNF